MKKHLLFILSVFITAFVSAQTVFNVLPPSAFAGNYEFIPTVQGGDADWDIPDMEDPANAIFGFMAVAYDDGTWEEDGTITADSLVCGPVANPDQIAGKVAVIYRGACFFSQKALMAQNAGAIGVMIVNIDGGAISGMSGGVDAPDVHIPLWLLENGVVTDWRPEIDAGVMEIFFGNKNGLFPNDIGINPANILRAKHFSYPRVLAQGATEYSFKLGAEIINFGSLDQTDVTLSAEITLDGNVVYNQTSETPVNIASGDTAFLNLSDFSMDTYESGLYELIYSSNIPEDDEFPSDNVFNANFMISDSLFSYGSIQSNGEPNAVRYWSQDGMSPDTEASSCIAFTDPHASRVVVEGLTFSASVGSELDPDGITDVIVDVFVYEWENEFADADDPNFAIAADGSSLNALASGSYEYIEDLQNENIYVPFGEVLTLEDDLRYLFCITYTQEFMFTGVGGQTLDYTTNFETYRQPINLQQGENDAGWSTFGMDSSFVLIPAMTVNMKDPLYDAINEEAQRVEITPFPNPTANEINIPVGNNYGQTLIDVYDIAGKKVKSTNVTTTSYEIIKFNVSDLDNGAYIFKMNFEDGSFSNFNVVVNN